MSHNASSDKKNIPHILSVSRHPRAWGDAGIQGENMRGVYQLGSLFQLSSTEAGLSVNLRYSGIRAVDLEIGSDLVIFDDSSKISAGRIQPLQRFSYGQHPKTGRKMLFARYPLSISFVPLGAKCPDGSAHPHAGTGFGINQMAGFPTDRLNNDVFDGMKEDEHYYAMELHQFSYDGKEFRETGVTQCKIDELLPGCLLGGGMMSTAIADGNDLLLPLSGGYGRIDGCGLVRFRRNNGNWQATEYMPVIHDREHFYTISGTVGNYIEPSVLREIDGSILFTMREVGAEPFAKGTLDAERLRVFRSADGGKSWETVVDQPHFHTLTPLSIVRAADGTPCIIANAPALRNYKNESVNSIVLREKMLLHELAPDRKSLMKPLTVCDAVGEYPEPFFNSWWRIDHPIGLPVRMKDGLWHGLLVYRVLEHAECDDDAPMTPLTGCYVQELNTPAENAPLWKF